MDSIPVFTLPFLYPTNDRKSIHTPLEISRSAPALST